MKGSGSIRERPLVLCHLSRSGDSPVAVHIARSASFTVIAHGKNGATRSEVGDRNVAAPCTSTAAGFYRKRVR